MRIRVAAMSARLIEVGDTLVEIPRDQGGSRFDKARVIGVVLEVRDMSWVVRSYDGDVFEHPSEGDVLTYIHVPSPKL